MVDNVKWRRWAKMGYVFYFERIWFKNWFNPLLTLYLNFRSFSLRQAVKLPVFVYGWPKLFSLYGSMECSGRCSMGMVKINQTNTGCPSAPGTSTAINNWGKIIFHGHVLIYTGCKICLSMEGVLEMGEGSKIMPCCNVTAHEYVKIGEQSRIAHRSQILDSNYHYVANFIKKKIPLYHRPIIIGDYCWVCNSSTVAAGAVIPDKTIVASNSLVNRDMSDIPEESIIGGIPAKLISTGFRKVESNKLQKDLSGYFFNHPEAKYYPIPDDFDHLNCNVD